jgi:hypothetical protein
MFGDRSIQKKNTAHRQIAKCGKQEAHKDWGLIAGANGPVNGSGDEYDAEQGLEFAPGCMRDTGLCKSAWMSFYISIHMQIEGQEEQSGIFGRSARDQ